MRRGLVLLGIVLIFSGGVMASLAVIRVADFSTGDLRQWEEKSFSGNTHYELIDSGRGRVLAARTDGAASSLYRKLRIDLNKTPYINWSWQVKNTFSNNDERSKEGDDYPARVYVVVSGGLFFWKTRAISYVWSSHQPAGSQWPNAFTSYAHMLAVRSGDKQLGEWIEEKRNVREDFQKLFGMDTSHVDIVAIMVDGDNTLQSAEASFGDIWFSAD